MNVPLRGDKIDLSIVIITKNAAATLPSTLSSLPSGVEIVVVDSMSTDATCDVARNAGAILYSKPFSDFSDQKNFAIAQATRSWVFSIDADEVVDATLAEALTDLAARKPTEGECFSVSRRLIFMGRAMRYGRTCDAPVRVAPRASAVFVGSIHECLTAKGATKPPQPLRGILLHHSYRDLNDYFEKFNRYTTLMAQERRDRGIAVPNRFSLALRPILNFCYRYVLCGGFLDGYPGYVWALLGSFYSFVKYEKFRELSAAQGKS